MDILKINTRNVEQKTYICKDATPSVSRNMASKGPDNNGSLYFNINRAYTTLNIG